MKKTILKIKRYVTFFSLPLLGGVGGGLLLSCSNNENSYDAMGMFEATEVVVSAKAQGELISFTINEGDMVKAGDTLGCIDVTLLSLQKQNIQEGLGVYDANSQQLDLSSASTSQQILDLQTQTASVRQQIENLTHERERFSSLTDKGAAAQKQVDDLDQQIAVLKQQQKSLEEQIASRNKSLELQSRALAMQSEAVKRQGSVSAGSIDIVKRQISDAVVVSPTTGTILQTYSEQGEYAVPGKALFKVADLSEMILRAYVTADQYDHLKLGQQVKIMVDNGNETQREYKGKVTWIAQKAEFTPKTIQTKDERANLVYAIKVSVKNDGMIKIGQYGECYFNK
ncbi:MAG: HlyD family efflux transporter periplasmic adaptor subunit [Bacteroidaceae bacterium]|nr:HlyD family efflux transporter periplasmic adaptor subunit [Bacteroidaceae bacterium]